MNMSKSSFTRRFLVGLVIAPPIQAEQQIQEVLHHTNEAVRAAGDSQAIGQHASDALALLGEAETANSAQEEVVTLLRQSEADLEAPVINAGRFNSATAWEDAVAAQEHLEAADQAADANATAPDIQPDYAVGDGSGP